MDRRALNNALMYLKQKGKIEVVSVGTLYCVADKDARDLSTREAVRRRTIMTLADKEMQMYTILTRALKAYDEVTGRKYKIYDTTTHELIEKGDTEPEPVSEDEGENWK